NPGEGTQKTRHGLHGRVRWWAGSTAEDSARARLSSTIRREGEEGKRNHDHDRWSDRGLLAGRGFVASGKADMICLARGAMWDPRWAWHAAEELGAETPYALKMMGCHPKLRPQLFPKRAQAAS